MDAAPSKPLGPAKAPTLPKSAARKEMPPVAVSAGQTLIMSLTLSLPEGTKLTEEAPSSWALSAEGEAQFDHCYSCLAFNVLFRCGTYIRLHVTVATPILRRHSRVIM